jgi:hypothetical protein
LRTKWISAWKNKAQIWDWQAEKVDKKAVKIAHEVD